MTASFRGALAAVYEQQAGVDAAGFPAALATLLASPDHALPVAASDDRGVWGPRGTADPIVRGRYGERLIGRREERGQRGREARGVHTCLLFVDRGQRAPESRGHLGPPR